MKEVNLIIEDSLFKSLIYTAKTLEDVCRRKASAAPEHRWIL